MNETTKGEKMEVLDRFFIAIKKLTEDKLIGGLLSFSTKYGISRSLMQVKRKHAGGPELPSSWLLHLVKDYKVNPYWVLLGEGGFYIDGFDLETIKKLQED